MGLKSRLKDRFDNFAAAMTGVPRGVPIFAQMHDHAARLAGVSVREFCTNPKSFVEVTILASEYYQFDFPRLLCDGYNIEAEALGQKMIYSDDALPDVDGTDRLVKTPSDLARLKPPDPHSAGRMPYVLEANRLYKELTGLTPNLTFCAPLSLAIQIRGYVNFVKDIRTRPAFAHELLTFLTDQVLTPWITTLKAEAGGDFLVLGADAWASPPNFTVEMLEEFDIPYILRLKERCGTASASGWWGESHLKDPRRLIEWKVQVRPGYLYGFDPDPEVLGPEIYKEIAVKHDCPLALGIDARLLRDGPPEALVARIRRYVAAGAPGGKFFILLSNIPADTPPEHIHLAVAAVRTFGRYPLADDLNQIAPPTLQPSEAWDDFVARLEPMR